MVKRIEVDFETLKKKKIHLKKVPNLVRYHLLKFEQFRKLSQIIVNF